MTTTVFVEVTNTLTVPFVTGLQRVTRELLARLPRTGDLAFEPVRWCTTIGAYRRLTDAEATALATAPRPAVGSRVARRLRRAATDARDRARRMELMALRVGAPWPDEAIWFDLEATWHNPRERGELLPELGVAGIATAALVADVLPELHPEWFDASMRDRFRSHLRAHLTAGSHLVCISRSTEHDVLRVARSVGAVPTTDVVMLGADFRHGTTGALPAGLDQRRYLLSVSTLEPRKNQALLLDVFDRLRDPHPDLALVLVGKQGWHVEELVARIRSHPDHGDRLRWLEGTDDSTLMALYRHAALCLVPSFSEGFGAPVVEGLSQGVPTICSTGGALTEVGGDRVERADPSDLDAWVRLVDRHLTDPAHHAAARAALVDYEPPTWADCAEQVLDALRSLT